MSGGLRSPAQAHLNQLFHGSEELDDDLTSVWPPPDQGSTLSSPAGEPGPPGDQADAKQDRDPDDSTSAGERPLVDMSLGNVLSHLTSFKILDVLKEPLRLSKQGALRTCSSHTQ